MDVSIGLSKYSIAVAGFSQRESSKDQWKPYVVRDPGNHALSFFQCPLGHTDELYLGWEGMPVSTNARKSAILGVCLENGRPFLYVFHLSLLPDKIFAPLKTRASSQ